LCTPTYIIILTIIEFNTWFTFININIVLFVILAFLKCYNISTISYRIDEFFFALKKVEWWCSTLSMDNDLVKKHEWYVSLLWTILCWWIHRVPIHYNYTSFNWKMFYINKNIITKVRMHINILFISIFERFI